MRKPALVDDEARPLGLRGPPADEGVAVALRNPVVALPEEEVEFGGLRLGRVFFYLPELGVPFVLAYYAHFV